MVSSTQSGETMYFSIIPVILFKVRCNVLGSVDESLRKIPINRFSRISIHFSFCRLKKSRGVVP